MVVRKHSKVSTEDCSELGNKPGLRVNWSESWTPLNHTERDYSLELKFTEVITTNTTIQRELVLTPSIRAQPGFSRSEWQSQPGERSGPLNPSSGGVPSPQTQGFIYACVQVGMFSTSSVLRAGSSTIVTVTLCDSWDNLGVPDGAWIRHEFFVVVNQQLVRNKMTPSQLLSVSMLKMPLFQKCQHAQKQEGKNQHQITCCSVPQKLKASS